MNSDNSPLPEQKALLTDSSIQFYDLRQRLDVREIEAPPTGESGAPASLAAEIEASRKCLVGFA